MFQLYDYWRSSAAYRVRIGLNLKGVSYENIPVNILPGIDEQMREPYRSKNPQMRVPALDTPQGREWWVLDHKLHPAPHTQPELRAQLARYRDAVAALQPGERVRAAFITAEGRAVELDAGEGTGARPA